MLVNFKFCAKKAIEDVEEDSDGNVLDDAREDPKEDGKVEDNESSISYRNLDHDNDVDSDQYRTEEGPVTRIDIESQEGYGNYKSELCQSIGKHTLNIISGIFVTIAATVILNAVGIYFATNSDNTTPPPPPPNTTSIFQ